MPGCRVLPALALAAGLIWVITAGSTPSAHAVTMTNDPKGFNNIPWGAALDGRPDLTLTATARRIKEYELKSGPLPLGDAKVDTMRLTTLDGKFARVTIHYRGKDVRDRVLAYLQTHYGALDRTPGQTMRSFNQQFNWIGTDTQINMTYEAQGERGYLFIESTLLAPQFIDSIHEQEY